MAAGVPMYYLTARSRGRQARGYSRVDGGGDSEGGFKATLRDAYSSFLDDVSRLLPARLAARLQPSAPPPRDGEERRGMLSERLEMSEI